MKNKGLKYFSMIVVTSMIWIYWMNEFAFVLVFAFSFPVLVPLAIASFWFTIQCRRLANPFQKSLFGWGMFNVLFLSAYFVFKYPDKQCNAPLMAEHYEEHAEGMDEFLEYVDKTLDDSASICLEFEDGEPAIFHVASKGDTKMSSHWEDAAWRKDALMEAVGLTQDEYLGIRKRLRDLGCIGFERFRSGHDAKTIIYFRRVGMGRYSFILYRSPMSQEERNDCLSDGQYIPYSDRVVFLYGGGAFGPQAFPREEKEEFLLRHEPW